jgi:uracil-DNA glycosylase
MASLFNHPLKLQAREAGARCDLCPCASASIPVTGIARPNPKIVIVGEGPGQVEERMGQPFVGKSGKFLDDLLQDQAKIPRAHVTILNAALCRHDTDEGNQRAGECCAPRLHHELAHVPARVPIVTLGSGSTSSVLGLDGIKSWRGFVFRAAVVTDKEVKAAERKAAKAAVGLREDLELKAATLRGRAALAGRIVLPTLHPAYVLRSELEKPTIEIDFRRVARIVSSNGNFQDAASRGTSEVVPPIPTRVKKALRGLSSAVSLDVETTETASALTAKLICVGIGDASGRVVVIWPWHERVAGTLAEFLRSRKAVVGHNMFQFDRVVLERHGVS